MMKNDKTWIGGPLMSREGRVIAALMLTDPDDSVWQEQIVEQNILQASSANTAKRYALPLFADAWKLAESDSSSVEPEDDDPEETDNEQHDLLGQMEITARLMLTGGELKEDARLTRSDRALIREAILHAARLTTHEKRQTLTQDIRDALFTLAQDAALPESRRNQLWEMGEAMNMFCSGFEGELFNHEGEAWPEADITLVDLAMFAHEGYEAQLAIAYIPLINHINNLGERDQHLARPIVNITDGACWHGF